MNFTPIICFLKKLARPISQHAPEILLGVGSVGVVAAGVLACKETLKVEDILQESQDQLKTIENVSSDEAYSEKYSQEDAKKDIAIVRGRTAIKLIKNYAPAVALAGLSLACIFAGHGIQRKRYAAVSAAYFALDQSFRKYVDNVKERFGDDVEHDIHYGIKAKEVTETVVNENGEEVEETRIVDVRDGGASPYARIFDEVSAPTCWQNDANFNRAFLAAREVEANRILKQQGYLTLNEMYKMLGMQPSKAGCRVGWSLNHKNSDGFVRFTYVSTPEVVKDFFNGDECSIMIDFNVDGIIDDCFTEY